MTYAFGSGRITEPGSDTGIRARLTAAPETTSGTLRFPDEERVTWGAQVVETDDDGLIPDTFKIPLGSDLGDDVIWRFTVEPLENVTLPKKWIIAKRPITADFTIDEITDVDLVVVTSSFAAGVAENAAAAEAAAAAAIAVGATNDTIIASRVNDHTSATAAALSTSYTQKPTTDQGDWALLRRNTSDSKGVVWTTPQATIARALGWTVSTDPAYAGGVKADGVTDDGPALAAAIASSGTRDVWVPRGTVLVNQGITLVSNQVLRGAGGKNATSIKAKSTLNTTTYPAVVTLDGNAAVLEHLQIDATDVPAADCVRVTSGYEVFCGHVKTIGGQEGFNLYASGLESRFEYCSAINAVGAGFRVQNVADAFFLNCSTDNCNFGLRASGGSITALHFHAINSLDNGFHLVGASSSQFYGCHADTSGKHGFYIFGADNLKMTDCWSFGSSHLYAGTYSNWEINGGTSGGITNTTLTGCGSTAESNCAHAWEITPNTGGIISLTLAGCSATTADLSGDLSAVTLVGCSGTLAKLNNTKRIRRKNISLTALASTTFDYDFGYTPAITSNFKPFKVTFTGRGRTEKVAVLGEFYFATSNDTTGTGVTAVTYFMGASTNAGAKFTFTITRTNSILTCTVTSTTSTDTIDLGFEIEPILEAKPS